jgi:hypothetical protein
MCIGSKIRYRRDARTKHPIITGMKHLGPKAVNKQEDMFNATENGLVTEHFRT